MRERTKFSPYLLELFGVVYDGLYFFTILYDMGGFE